MGMTASSHGRRRITVRVGGSFEGEPEDDSGNESNEKTEGESDIDKDNIEESIPDKSKLAQIKFAPIKLAKSKLDESKLDESKLDEYKANGSESQATEPGATKCDARMPDVNFRQSNSNNDAFIPHHSTSSARSTTPCKFTIL